MWLLARSVEVLKVRSRSRYDMQGLCSLSKLIEEKATVVITMIDCSRHASDQGAYVYGRLDMTKADLRNCTSPAWNSTW